MSAKRSPANRKKPCEYRNCEGNSSEGCLGAFELNSSQGGSNRKYCRACQKLATRDRSAKHHASEDPEKLRNRNRDQRRKAAEAAGRRYREMGAMRLCAYRDREGAPGKGCLGEFLPKSGIQIHCENCRRLARNDRNRVNKLAAYRADKAANGERYEQHLKRGRKSSANFHSRQRKQAAVGRIFEELKSRPVSWRLIVPLVVLDPSLTRAGIRKLVGTEGDLTPRQMTRLGAKIREWLPSWPGFGAKLQRPKKHRN